MLDLIETHTDTELCLDAAIWLSDFGETDEYLLRSFVVASMNERGAEVRYEAAIVQLCDWGLLTHEPSPMGYGCVRFHLLTWEILAELRRDRADALLRRVFNVYATHDLRAASERAPWDELHTWLATREMELVHELGDSEEFRTWGKAFIIGGTTFLHVGPATDDQDPPLHLYQLKDDTIYELSAGTLRELSDQEVEGLHLFMQAFRPRAEQLLLGGLDAEVDAWTDERAGIAEDES
jgi:hypothetical protein